MYKKFPFFDDDGFSKKYLPGDSDNKPGERKVKDGYDEILDTFLPTINDLLLKDGQGSVKQQYGQTIKRYGMSRLNLTSFILNIITQGQASFALKLAPCLPTLLDQCREFQWNSMLHNNVELIFNEIFKKDSQYDDAIRTAIIAEANLADYIANLDTDVQMPVSGRYIRSGIVATFYKIANLLNLHTSEYVQAELTGSEKWQEFIVTELQDANDNNEQALAGHQSKGNDSDENASNYETSMDKLFAQFTSLKESHDNSRELEEKEEAPGAVEDTKNILASIHKEDEEKKKQAEAAQSKGQTADGSADKTTTSVLPETQEKDDVQESNEFHDNSYWSLDSGFKLDDLLQDV